MFETDSYVLIVGDESIKRRRGFKRVSQWEKRSWIVNNLQKNSLSPPDNVVTDLELLIAVSKEPHRYRLPRSDTAVDVCVYPETQSEN
jgi:hypothetical protein